MEEQECSIEAVMLPWIAQAIVGKLSHLPHRIDAVISELDDEHFQFSHIQLRNTMTKLAAKKDNCFEEKDCLRFALDLRARNTKSPTEEVKFHDQYGNAHSLLPVYTMGPKDMNAMGLLSIDRFGDKKSGYRRGFKWQNNSCAVDTALVLARLLDAGLQGDDFLPIADFRNLPPLAKMLRGALIRSWTELTASQLTKLRNEFLSTLLESLNLTNSVYLALSDVLEHLFNGIRQVSFSQTTMVGCCCEPASLTIDGTGDFKRNVMLNSRPGLDPQPHGSRYFQLQLEAIFKPKTLANNSGTGDKSCSKCSTSYHEYVALDRAPQTLLLNDGFSYGLATVNNGDTWREPFNAVSFKYPNLITREYCLVRYRLRAVVWFRNDNHFSLSFREGHTWYNYNDSPAMDDEEDEEETHHVELTQWNHVQQRFGRFGIASLILDKENETRAPQADIAGQTKRKRDPREDEACKAPATIIDNDDVPGKLSPPLSPFKKPRARDTQTVLSRDSEVEFVSSSIVNKPTRS